MSVTRNLGPVLIANRGEIAVRIMATCQRLGLPTVAVYSDADAHARHVAEADRAVRIGPPQARESYLNQGAMLQAARETGSRAIHPGYGFLAENPEFAEKVKEAGLIWIGPPPAAMRALGDKSRAKALADKHQVPVLPGYHGEDQSPDKLAAEADRIGYPLLIKASAGGGGRGMRVVASAETFLQALEGAKRESQASFGDDRVLLERYVARPRHIEIQILGDLHGNLVHLCERECSIQRRHQKLIEETPSPAVDEDLRQRMGEAALRLARAAGYANAGTVEFLLDEAGQFAFLEVNARLQVEHPVTEAVTRLDLVELQLQVAAGEPLPITQPDIQLDGHAIEARVIAEDPQAGFLPSSGLVEQFDIPPDARVDTWVSAGTRVSPYYDSLLAKVIAYADTRAHATQRLAHALREFRIRGVQNNLDLLLATVESPAFLQGELHTGFLQQHELVDQLSDIPSAVLAAASVMDVLLPAHSADPWRAITAWRIARTDQPAAWTRGGATHSARVSSPLDSDGVDVETGSSMHHVQLISREVPLRVSVDGESISVWDNVDHRLVEWRDQSFRLLRTPPPSVEETGRERAAGGGAGSLLAPMPARVVKVNVAEGEQVRQNQPLIVLEAMKMEHVVEAPHAGTVTAVCVEPGQQVAGGMRLLTIGSDQTTGEDVE
jgi:3-methylcrotonyl-CoA carboxylase alpha subunit